MKMTMMISLLFGCLMFSHDSFAKGQLNQILEKKEENQSTVKKRRRKKVQMCHECGKPEPQCECEGEDHGVKNEHEHKDEHNNE